MKHLGDITKLDGHKLPPVDVITGGSPCQDLSVAGRREGLAGERSGLFMEQCRIVKEMRAEYERNHGADLMGRPRYMVWENVPGSLSSPGVKNGENHKGEDFQTVLTEIARIAKKDCPDVPLPRDRKWPYAGCLVGIGDRGGPFSIAWRLHDAQFWGVSVTDHNGNLVKRGTPQRRRRICVIADFGGLTAPDILFDKVLFESEGLSGHFEPSKTKGEGITEGTERGAGESSTDALDLYNFQITGEIAATLNEESCSSAGHSGPSVMYKEEDSPFCGGFKPRNSACARSVGYEEERSPTIGTDENYAVAVDLYNQTLSGEVSKTLNSVRTDSDHTPCVIT